MIAQLFYLSVVSLFSLSRCSPRLDGKEHFDFKFSDEFGVDNLYLLPYVDVVSPDSNQDDKKLVEPSNPLQFDDTLRREADDRPYQLTGPFAEDLEQMERNRNIHRRTFYCNLVWSSWDDVNKTFTERNQIYYHSIPYVTFEHVDCEPLSRIARQHCFQFAKEAFHGSVSPLSVAATENACDYFGSTVAPKERRRIYLVYKVDNCDTRVYKKLGDVCCWKCVGRTGRASINPKCLDTPPSDCDLSEGNRRQRRARPEKMLIL